MSFVGALVIGIRLPKTKNRVQSTIPQPGMWKLFSQPRLFVSVVVSALLLFIFILFMIFWTLWLSDDFGFGPIEIGLMGTFIGLAEFIGLLLAMLFVDQIGKRRGSLIGLLGSSICFALISIFQQPLFAVRIILILTAVVIEFALTASIPLFAEQAPKARATVFSLVAFGNTIGIGLGPPVTTYLWTSGGLNAIIITGMVSSLFAFFLVWKFLFDSPYPS